MPRLALGSGMGPVVASPRGSTIRLKEIHGAVQNAAPTNVGFRGGWLTPVIRSTWFKKRSGKIFLTTSQSNGDIGRPMLPASQTYDRTRSMQITSRFQSDEFPVVHS